MIEVEYEFDPGREKIFDACLQLCLENRFDPVVAYLNELRWDAKDRRQASGVQKARKFR
jgi:hypothetical protein